MFRRYSRLRSSSSAKRLERDTYLFQGAEDSAQIADAQEWKGSVDAGAPGESQVNNKFVEKAENRSPKKHFMASIWKVTALREKQRSLSSVADKSVADKDNSDAGKLSEPLDLQQNNLRRASSLTDTPSITKLEADQFLDLPADSRKMSAAEDSESTPALLRSTSARDASLEVSINDIGSLEAAVHRALSVREGRLKVVDGQKPASFKDKQSRIVLSSKTAPVNGFFKGDSHTKEQIKMSPSFEQKPISIAQVERRSSESWQGSQADGKVHNNEVAKSYEEVKQNQGLAQKPVQKTQSMRYSLIATDVEEAWVPARNSSYFGPTSLPKGAIFGGFDGVNLYHNYSAMDVEVASLECRVCGCELGSVVDEMRSVNGGSTDICHDCRTLPAANDQLADFPKAIKKKGGLIKACRRILRLSKKNSFP